jgi:hypothetical protein
MTEDEARRSAEALAFNMGITFYVVRNRDGGFAAVQLPPDDSEIRVTVLPSVHDRGLDRRDAESRSFARGAIKLLAGREMMILFFPVRSALIIRCSYGRSSVSRP